RVRLKGVPEDARAELMSELGEAEALRDVEARLTQLATPRRDYHHPVRRLRAVDRGCGSSLQHLDVLDVVGVQVRDAIHLVLLQGRRIGARGRQRDAVQ